MNRHPLEIQIITTLVLAAGLICVSACSLSPSDPGYIPPGWTEPELAYDKEAYFPVEVTDFVQQAPGQYANNENFRIKLNTDKLLGPPAGGGTYVPDHSSLVSLGMAGGYVVLAFDPPIKDHPDNIGGYDFIVFGNAYWSGGDPKNMWQEPGTVWVMKDEDGNGSPDDTWYLIPGSHLAASDSPQTVSYDKDPGTPAPPPADKIDAWWPVGTDPPLSIDNVFILPESLYKTGGFSELCWGYCDAAPTLLLGDMSGADGSGTDNSLDETEDYPEIDPVYFYTTPDDHTTTGIDTGSGGGNAIDLAWAVDPADFSPAGPGGSGLDEVSWVKIVSASMDTNDLGDYSCEVDAVARVRRKQ
jgi:hypothetical protein